MRGPPRSLPTLPVAAPQGGSRLRTGEAGSAHGPWSGLFFMPVGFRFAVVENWHERCPASSRRDAGCDGRRPARAHVRACGAGHGLRNGGARPGPGQPGRAASRTITSTPSTSTARACAACADLSDAVTTEFENVPARALARWASSLAVAPGADAVSVCQDRAAEKAQFVRSGVRCAPHAVIESDEQVQAVADGAAARHPEDRPSRLRRQGPGDRDHARRARRGLALDAARALRAGAAAAARGGAVASSWRAAPTGHAVHLPVQQNLHRDGILAVTQVPAPGMAQAVQREAVDGALRIASDLALRRRAVRRVLRARRRHAGGQRDGAASAQLRPLQHRRLRRVAVRPAGALRWPACRWWRRACTRRP